MTRNERLELNELSKRAFGASSRWQKLVTKGFAEPHERNREVMIPRANGELVTKVFTDKKFIVKHYSVEEVRKLMTDILATRTPPAVELVGSTPSDQIDIPSNSSVTLDDGTTVSVIDTASTAE